MRHRPSSSRDVPESRCCAVVVGGRLVVHNSGQGPAPWVTNRDAGNLHGPPDRFHRRCGLSARRRGEYDPHPHFQPQVMLGSLLPPLTFAHARQLDMATWRVFAFVGVDGTVAAITALAGGRRPGRRAPAGALLPGAGSQSIDGHPALLDTQLTTYFPRDLMPKLSIPARPAVAFMD